MFKIQIDFDAELTKIHSRTLTDAFRHSANGPEFQLWPALSLSCYLVRYEISYLFICLFFLVTFTLEPDHELLNYITKFGNLFGLSAILLSL